jgi:hypothetical protein
MDGRWGGGLLVGGGGYQVASPKVAGCMNGLKKTEKVAGGFHRTRTKSTFPTIYPGKNLQFFKRSFFL